MSRTESSFRGGGIHDIRDSLNAVALNSDLLLRILPEGAGEARCRSVAERIRGEAYRLAGLVDAFAESVRREYDLVEEVRAVLAGLFDGRPAPRVSAPESVRVRGNPALLRKTMVDVVRSFQAGARLEIGIEPQATGVLLRLRAGEGADGGRETCLLLPLRENE